MANVGTPKKNRALLRALEVAIAHHEELIYGEDGYAFKNFKTITSHNYAYSESMARRELGQFRTLRKAVNRG